MSLLIKDLKKGMNGVTVVAKVVKKSEISEHAEKKFAFALIDDKSGTIKLNLWREQASSINVGDLIKVHGAFVHSRNRVKQLSTWAPIEVIG